MSFILACLVVVVGLKAERVYEPLRTRQMPRTTLPPVVGSVPQGANLAAKESSSPSQICKPSWGTD